MYKVIFVDDREEEFKILDNLKGGNGGNIEIKSLLPKQSLTETANEILGLKPDLLILDFRLDEKALEPNIFANYKASPLAQHLRDFAVENIRNDFPIFALSNENKIRKFYTPNKTAHDLFDRIYLKKDILNSPDPIRREFISYMEAFKVIIEHFGEDDMFIRLLRIEENESGFIDNQFFREICQLKAPHLIARNIFPLLIERAWLLLDIDNLIALLGINPKCKDGEDFFKLLDVLNQKNNKYDGIFGSGFERWWVNRVKCSFEEICSETSGDLTARERVDCLNENLRINLKPAISRWKNSSNTYVSFACNSCKNPTEEEFSVAAYDPTHHDFPGKKRICWKCVQTGEYEERNLLIDEGDLFIAEKIKNGEVKPD